MTLVSLAALAGIVIVAALFVLPFFHGLRDAHRDARHDERIRRRYR